MDEPGKKLLGFWMTLALVVGMREPRLRPFAFAAALLLDVAIVLSLSRAAILAAGIGQALFFGLDQLQLRRGPEWAKSRRSARGVSSRPASPCRR